MPIIPEVGRKAWNVRLSIWAIYLVLCAGSVLMVVPLLLMLTGSTASFYSDVQEITLLPRFLFDEDTLISKYLEEKYTDWHQRESRYTDLFHQFALNLFDPRKSPRVRYQAARRLAEPGVAERIEDWKAFKAQLPWRFKTTYFFGDYTFLLETEILARYRRYLKQRYGSLEKVNEAYAEQNEGFDMMTPPLIELSAESDGSPQAVKWRDWDRFRRWLPVRFHMVLLGNGLYQSWVVEAKYMSLQRLNEAWGTEYKSKYEIQIPQRLPSNAVEAGDWELFARTKAPMEIIELSGGEAAFRDYVAGLFTSVEAFNQTYQTAFASLEDVPFHTCEPQEKGLQRLWQAFVRYHCPAEALSIQNGENLFRQWLSEQYGSLDAVNERYASSCASFDEITPPCVLVDLSEVLAKKWRLRGYFLVRNYVLVIRYMLTRGRAFWNTLVLVLGTLAVQLTVNPLAAYALSRFKLPYAYKILVFLLGTMAFPAAVGMVPNFLLLKQLGMLNTYWALILPGAANGFFIFILKGFFDSLPEELFEIATVEGASSFWQFRHVVVPLSKPIFAVIALGAFNAAYGGFMWAFLVCQDERMWTLMVWLQQFAQNYSGGLLMAALTLAGIPTLIVFVFCQRIIIRGIVIPQFK